MREVRCKQRQNAGLDSLFQSNHFLFRSACCLWYLAINSFLRPPKSAADQIETCETWLKNQSVSRELELTAVAQVPFRSD